jgi:tRNA-2-methylthio-N6-dimethylallyladenosine synthase
MVIVNCYIKVYGCQMNAADSSILSRLLADSGIHETPDETDADVVVLLTCSVRQHAEERASGFARTMRGMGKKVVVAGCMGKLRARELVDSGIADYVLGPDEYRLLPGLLTGKTSKGAGDFETYADLLPSAAGSVSSSIAIIRGCNNFCTYCVVPYARGPERSIPYESIERQVRHFVEHGAKEIFLLGQNVLAYNHDGTKFVDILERLSCIDEVERLGFITSHPRDLSRRDLERMAGFPKLLAFFHLPLQSASENVLAAMHRGYSLEMYEMKVAWIRELFSNPYITTDLLVGFPGETTRDFQATLDAVERIGFDFAYMFAYSERPGTAAQNMSCKIADSEKRRRLRLLIDHVNSIARERASRLVGSEEEIFITAPAPRGDGDMLAELRNHRSIIFKQTAVPGERLFARIVRLEGLTLLAEPSKKEVV